MRKFIVPGVGIVTLDVRAMADVTQLGGRQRQEIRDHLLLVGGAIAPIGLAFVPCRPKALLDGGELTLRRTGAASALASRFSSTRRFML